MDLNKKYSPSAWNPNLTPEEVIQSFMRIGAECQAENQSLLQCHLNLSYGDSMGMRYDVYERRDLPRDAPIFVFIHGGYWQEGTRGGNTFMVKPLVSAGFRVFLIGYDLCPKVPLKQLYDQIQVGLSEILRRAGQEFGCARVLLSGHSAGACLAISMLSRERWSQLPGAHLIRLVILLGGIYDLSEARHTDTVNRGNLLGLTEEDVPFLSPLQQEYSHLGSVTDLRVCIVTAELDAPELVQQGQRMKEKLKREGVSGTELVEASAFDHFDLVTELRGEECFLIRMIVDEKNRN